MAGGKLVSRLKFLFSSKHSASKSLESPKDNAKQDEPYILDAQSAPVSSNTEPRPGQQIAVAEGAPIVPVAGTDSTAKKTSSPKDDATVLPVSEEAYDQTHGASSLGSTDAPILHPQPQGPLAEPLPKTAASGTPSLGGDTLEEAGNSSQVPPSAKTTSSDRKLWDKAIDQLQKSKEDPNIVAVVNEFTVKVANSNAAENSPSPKDFAKDIKKEMELEIKGQPNNSKTHHFVEKTISILNKFVSVGDVAVTFDPVHAALPWAAVRFVLQILTASSELRTQLLGGIAKVTSLVLQCGIYQELYMGPNFTLRPLEDSLVDLETSIVRAYAKSQLFLGFAIQRQRSWSKALNAPFKLDDVSKYVERLVESGDQLALAADNCEKQCSYLNRAAVKNLRDLAKESRQAIGSVLNTLIQVDKQLNQIATRDEMRQMFQEYQAPSQAPSKARAAIFMVDFDRDTKSLVSRENIYDSISRGFGSGNHVALWGLGGVGKSRIAIEFLYRTANDDPGQSIYWVSAASSSRFLDSLRSIMRWIPEETLEKLEKFNTSTVGDTKILDVPQLINDWLSHPQSGPWLLILDNADTAEIFEKDESQKHPYIWYIPKSRGRVLMTTRSRGIAERLVNQDSGVIHVPLMSTTEAVDLFKSSLPNDTTPVSKVEDLAKALDFLPLAIMQAVAYIRSFKPLMSIGGYLTLFQKTEAEEERLLQRDFSDAVRDPDDLTNAVIITWQLNFGQIVHYGHATTGVISYLAVLDRETIPMFLLTAIWTQNDLVEDVGLLVQYSFIFEAASPAQAPEENMWSIHRLVHRTMRIWLRNGGQEEHWQQKAVEVLSNTFSAAIHARIWWQARLLLPHVRLALSYPAASSAATSTLREMVAEFERPRWLSIGRETSESAAIQARQNDIEGSFKWLFNQEQFVSWLHGGLPMLFLLGERGSGKTALCSRVVRYLSDPNNSADGAHVLYYFTTSKSANQFSDCLQTLLHQLWADREDIPDDVRFVLAAISAPQETPTTQSLISTLCLALDRTAEDVYIILDGIPGSDLQQTLPFFQSLKADRRRIMIASRPFPMFEFIQPHAQIRIDDFTNFDFEILISNRLKNINMPDEIRHRITERLLYSAEGSILWLKLVLKVIEKELQSGSSFHKLEEAIASTPRSLDALYNHALDRIEDLERNQAENIFAWLAFTFRPLSCEEFIEALAPQDSHSGENLVPERLEAVADRLVASVSSLVEVRDGIVQLAHPTVREFLLYEPSRLGLSEQLAHTRILSTCFKTLLDEPDVTRPHFLGYAAKYWTKHLEAVVQILGGSDSLPPDTVNAWKKLFNVTQPRFFLRWVRYYDPLDPEADPSQRLARTLEDFPSQKTYMETISTDVRAAIEAEEQLGRKEEEGEETERLS